MGAIGKWVAYRTLPLFPTQAILTSQMDYFCAQNSPYRFRLFVVAMIHLNRKARLVLCGGETLTVSDGRKFVATRT